MFRAKPLHVCIDIQSAMAQRAGVGRYTKHLVENLAAACAGDSFTLFYFDFKRQGRPFAAPGARERAVRWLPGRLVQKTWKTAGFPPFNWFAPGADVYHFPNFVRPPLTRGRSVVTLHDLSFVHFPETMEERNLRYLSAQMRQTVERSDAIITDSYAIAREVAEHFPESRGKTHPIWLGLSPSLHTPAPEAVAAARTALGLDRPYLLFVGTLEPRKNVSFLVEVFERMAGFDGDLVLAGGLGWKFEPVLERLRASPRAGRIRHLAYVDEAHLPGLYAGAELFLFPSLYEGFGFTPLEAMAAGTPVLSSDRGSLGEVLGGAALILHELDADRWAEEATRLLAAPESRSALREKGAAHARQFRWEETARQTWQVYRSLA